MSNDGGNFQKTLNEQTADGRKFQRTGQEAPALTAADASLASLYFIA